jgi:hypothetical protein
MFEIYGQEQLSQLSRHRPDGRVFCIESETLHLRVRYRLLCTFDHSPITQEIENVISYDRFLMQASAGRFMNTCSHLIRVIPALGWIRSQRTQHSYDAVTLFALPAWP